MAVYPPDGVTYHISELFVATGGLRRGLGGHVVFRIRGEVEPQVANFSFHRYHVSESPSLAYLHFISTFIWPYL
jgi:hypothetical protein